MDGRPTWTDCDEAGDYILPNVLSPRDLVFRPDNMDETVPHTCPPLAMSVLSSSVEPLSQSLAVTVYLVVDGDVCCVKPFLNIFHMPTTRCPVFWRNGLKCIFRQLFTSFFFNVRFDLATFPFSIAQMSSIELSSAL